MLKAPQELECIKNTSDFVVVIHKSPLKTQTFSALVEVGCSSQYFPGKSVHPKRWEFSTRRISEASNPSIFSQGTYIACSVDSPWNIKSWKTKCCQSLVSTNPAVFRMGFSGRGVFYTPASASGSASGGDFALHVGGWLNQLFEKRCAPSKMGSSFPSNSGENNKTNRWNRKYPVLEFLGLKVLFFWGSWNYPWFDQSGSICG